MPLTPKTFVACAVTSNLLAGFFAPYPVWLLNFAIAAFIAGFAVAERVILARKVRPRRAVARAPAPPAR
jgi:hypothetical protein